MQTYDEAQKLKNYFESIGAKKIEMRFPRLCAWRVRDIDCLHFNGREMDYRIPGDPHWKLRQKWVLSDFTLPIEVSNRHGEWHSSDPSWVAEYNYREATSQVSEYNYREATSQVSKFNVNPHKRSEAIKKFMNDIKNVKPEDTVPFSESTIVLYSGSAPVSPDEAVDPARELGRCTQGKVPITEQTKSETYNRGFNDGWNSALEKVKNQLEEQYIRRSKNG